MRRGLGKWQRVILDELESGPSAQILLHLMMRRLGRQPSPSEYSACNRAAHNLAARGLCKMDKVVGFRRPTWNEFLDSAVMLAVALPDAKIPRDKYAFMPDEQVFRSWGKSRT